MAPEHNITGGGGPNILTWTTGRSGLDDSEDNEFDGCVDLQDYTHSSIDVHIYRTKPQTIKTLVLNIVHFIRSHSQSLVLQ